MKKNVFILSIMALMVFSCDTEPITSMEPDKGLSPTAAKASINATYGYFSFSSAMASNGHTLFMQTDNAGIFPNAGDNMLSIHPKSVQGSGIFTHSDENGDLVASGTWAATQLLSFKNYGPPGDPNIPTFFRAGFANIRVHMVADTGPGAGSEFDAILRIRCLVPGNDTTPSSWVEGIRITVQNGLNFNKTVIGGFTLFFDLN